MFPERWVDLTLSGTYFTHARLSLQVLEVPAF